GPRRRHRGRLHLVSRSLGRGPDQAAPRRRAGLTRRGRRPSTAGRKLRPAAPAMHETAASPRLGCWGGATNQPDHAWGRRPEPGPDVLRAAGLAGPGNRGDGVLPGRRHGAAPLGPPQAGRRCGYRGQQRRWLRRSHAGAQRPVAGRGRWGAGRGGIRGGRDNAGSQGDLLRRLRRLLPGSGRPHLGDRPQPGLLARPRRLDHDSRLPRVLGGGALPGPPARRPGGLSRCRGTWRDNKSAERCGTRGLRAKLEVSTSERLTRNVVIAMTANQPRALRAVRRAARALSSVNDQQVAMWEAYWRAGRFPPKKPGTTNKGQPHPTTRPRPPPPARGPRS